MPVWKVLFIVVFGCVCMTLAFATFIVPMTMVESGDRWLSLRRSAFCDRCYGDAVQALSESC